MPTVPNVGAKGDLVVGSPNLTWRVLGVGTNDHVPYARSGAVLGIAWAHPDTLIHMNESVIYEDMTIPASRHWFIYQTMTVEAGNTLTLEPGAKVVLHG